MNLDPAFISQMEHLLGEEANVFFEALATETPVSIRKNCSRNTAINADEKIAWCADAFYLKERPSYVWDPLFHAGAYYPQEASSMFLDHVLRQVVKAQDIAVLDLCAAPGGKSTLIANYLDGKGVLVANEVIRQRASILKENIQKWGYNNTIVTSADASVWAKKSDLFDVVVVDAPCSGEGMFRKDQVAIDEWSPENVQLCASRQRRILADIWTTLKPGGYLIYSTCTFNLNENEENVLWAESELGAKSLEVPLEKEWGVTTSFLSDVNAYRFMPHKTKGEGFFIAVLKKSGEFEELPPRRAKKQAKKSRIPQEILSLTTGITVDDVFESNVGYSSFPAKYGALRTEIESIIKPLVIGCDVASVKGKNIIPDEKFIFSSIYKSGSLPEVEVTVEEALKLQSKLTIVLDGAPKGWVVCTVNQQPVALIKNLGNRINNYFPSGWRIRLAIDKQEELPEPFWKILIE